MRTIQCGLLLGLVMLAASTVTFAQEDLIELVEKKALALAAKISAAGKSRVAVLDFTALDAETITELARLLAELLNVHLASVDGISVIDRFHLENVLKEQKLSKSGLFNPKLSSKIGELSGVQAVIIGTISEIGKKLIVSFKVIDTETATNIGTELLVLQRTEDINRLFNTILSGETTDAYASSDKVYVNSASFFTDWDTIRCRGLGTFKSFPHAHAQACYVQPKKSSSEYDCAYLNQDETWRITIYKRTNSVVNVNDSCQYPQGVLERLVKENGRY